MGNNNNIEFNTSGEKNDSPWDLARPLLSSEDYRMRNRGVNVLIHRLSSKSRTPLLELDEESYREGFELLLETADDENYTVRTFAVTALTVVYESTLGEENYEDINEIALNRIKEAMFDEDLRVLNVAIGIMGEVISVMKEEIKELQGEEKEGLMAVHKTLKKKIRNAKIRRARKLLS